MLRHPHHLPNTLPGIDRRPADLRWPYRGRFRSNLHKTKRKLCTKRACVILLLFLVVLGPVVGIWIWYRSFPIRESDMKPTLFFWGPRGLALSPDLKAAQTDPNRKVDLFFFAGEEWEAFMSFITNAKFERPFVVVASGFDFTIPEEIFAEIGLSSPRLPPECLAWFSTNIDLYKYPQFEGRIFPIPIGVDFDAKSRRMYHAFVEGFGWKTLLKPSRLIEFPIAPHVQEHSLLRILSGAADTENRKLKVYGDFWVNKGYGRSFAHFAKRNDVYTMNREQVYNQVKNNPFVDLTTYRLGRLDAWRAKSEYMFELSIPGNGMDCYRTWEALALGIIVITITSPLDALFKDLPVVILDDLEDITETNLLKWKHQFRGVFRNETVRRKLTNEYWVQKVLDVVRQSSKALD